MLMARDAHRRPATAATRAPRGARAWAAAAVLVALTGLIAPGPAGAQTPYVGEIRLAGFNFAPAGWIPCDGRLLSILDYDVLFNLIGTTYGGDGVNTFAVPDLRGRVPVEAGQGPGLSPYVIGQQFGQESVTLGVAQLPVHTHAAAADSGVGSTDSPAGALHARDASGVPRYGPGAAVRLAPGAVLSAGGSQPHENRPPYLVANYFISLFGIYPSQAKPGETAQSKPVIVRPGQTMASLRGLVDVRSPARPSTDAKLK
jgi:microcystin-dependent protein